VGKKADKPDQLRMDYAETFNSPAGKRVLADILTTCHVLEPEQDNDPNNIIARAHRRDVAHHIMFSMGYGPADLPTIIEETQNA
jgi:hypothetical protein